MVHAGDGSNKIYVVQQQGQIYVFANTSSVSERRLFIDLSSRVSQFGGETGLLGLAFHPGYSHNGYFYVNYTSSSSGPLQSFVSRFKVSSTNPDSALTESELILLTVDQPFSNHNGGNIRFGPDGYLYVAFGDGGSGGDPQNNAQNRSTLLGKILRIDVNAGSQGRNYAIPPTNPYVSNTLGFREEIYAYGLRNPWKMSFDREGGTLWTGDVGQNLWEEIDTIVAGGNYGWKKTEGRACYSPSSGCDTTGLMTPVWVYAHSQGNISVTGGYVYRGSTLPALRGSYLYGDYGSGMIWALSFNGSGSPINQLIVDSPYLIASFGEDQTGEIYVLSYSDGRIYKVTQTGTSAENSHRTSPTPAVLEQNYPNPSKPRTAISFQLSASCFVSIKVFDLLGQEVATLANGIRAAGRHTVPWNGSALPNGMYFYRLQSADFVQTRTMLLMR